MLCYPSTHCLCYLLFFHWFKRLRNLSTINNLLTHNLICLHHQWGVIYNVIAYHSLLYYMLCLNWSSNCVWHLGVDRYLFSSLMRKCVHVCLLEIIQHLKTCIWSCHLEMKMFCFLRKKCWEVGCDAAERFRSKWERTAVWMEGGSRKWLGFFIRKGLNEKFPKTKAKHVAQGLCLLVCSRVFCRLKPHSGQRPNKDQWCRHFLSAYEMSLNQNQKKQAI